MRYSISEGTYILAKFPTGSTVTISLYKLSDSSSVTLTSNSMTEISTVGIFKWNTSNITSQPASFTEYLWIASNGTYSQYGKIVLGGDAANIWGTQTSTLTGVGTTGEKVASKLATKSDIAPLY